ncbi:MAG: fibronectin type III domain-containing protein [Gammaproteobacteria bacterium]|nr:MAG: fibronectin type III domain-containing protein [Gammaproteobacteria bacterium]TND04502.1 MAG: fibronectin type III domain-containing protein [Gammaproteobacteria bacterium]
MYQLNAQHLREIVTSIAIPLILAACGGESSKGDVSSSTSGVSIAYVTVSGSVGDGPVTGAQLTIYDANGRLVTSTTSDQMANYSVTFGIDANFPLTVISRGGVDMVTGTEPTFDMISVIPSPVVRVANVNPFSTLITKMAAAMPNGVSDATLKLARDIIFDTFSFGLDPTSIADPVTSAVTERNAASMVKASEVLAEMIRRVHAVLHPLNKSATETEVLNTLAADLTDGYLDGEGTAGSNSLAAAVAKIVEAEVLVEALTNNLKVNGAWSTGALDNALNLIMPGSLLTTSNVDISNAILSQTSTALTAVNSLIASANVDAVRAVVTDALASELSSLVMGIKPVKLELQLTYDLSPDFQNALNIVTSDTTSSSTINSTAKGQKANSTPKVNLFSRDSAVEQGSATMLTWAASNSAACTASGGWSGVKTTSGNEGTATIASRTDFVLTCFGTNGRTAAASVSVDVIAPQAPVSGGGTVDATPTLDGGSTTTPSSGGTVEVIPTPDTGTATTPSSGGTVEVTPIPDTGTITTPSNLIIRVNAGGSDYTDTAGNLWKADYGYNTGSAFSVADPVAGTGDDVLYQSERWDDPTGDELEYTFTVPNGHYLVNLRFMDQASRIGWRVFDVQIEGRIALDKLDIYAEVGQLAALTKGMAVDVTDGQMNIRFLHVLQNPKIDAIEIIQLEQLPTTTTQTVISPNTGIVSAAPMKLSWNSNPSLDNVVGYSVYYGGDENSVSIPLGDIRTDSVGFSPAAPSVTYNPETDLGLQAGNRVCFKIRAYNADGFSGWSTPVCSLIAQAI